MSNRNLLILWIVALLAPVGGDLALWLLAREARAQIPWLDVRVTRPLPDSLKHAASRYLHEVLGVTTEHRDDTLTIRVPRAAERTIDGLIDSARVASRRVLPWLLVGVVLWHLPLGIAGVVTVVALADRERRVNRAVGAPWQDHPG